MAILRRAGFAKAVAAALPLTISDRHDGGDRNAPVDINFKKVGRYVYGSNMRIGVKIRTFHTSWKM